jgi:hypothetical protein
MEVRGCISFLSSAGLDSFSLPHPPPFLALFPEPSSARWDWSYLIADEAHALKNRSSIRTRKLRRVAVTCDSRILLTGERREEGGAGNEKSWVRGCG